jgi:hypothetical protein
MASSTKTALATTPSSRVATGGASRETGAARTSSLRPPLFVGATVTGGQEDVHQADRHGQEGERLKVHGRPE